MSNSRATLTQVASVEIYSNLNSLGIVSVVLRSPSVDPKNALVPTPITIPTTTIYVTEPPEAVVNPDGAAEGQN